MSNKLRRVLVKVDGQLLTFVIDYLADIESTIQRIIDDYGIDYRDKGFKIVSDNYNA